MMFRWFDYNQGLNDQRLIYLEVHHTTYTSIFQHKTKSHILKRDIEVASQKNPLETLPEFSVPQDKFL